MDDIPIGDAGPITDELSKRLLAMFKVFRQAHPSHLKFVFNRANHQMNIVEAGEMRQILQANELSDGDMDVIFDRSGRANVLVG